MTPRSGKAKGRRLQNTTRDLILARYPDLTPADVLSTTMGETGMDVKLSAAARVRFPFAVEARNQESINVWECIKDAERHAAKEGLTPLGVIGRNHQAPYALVPLDVFIGMMAVLWYSQNRSH